MPHVAIKWGRKDRRLQANDDRRGPIGMMYSSSVMEKGEKNWPRKTQSTIEDSPNHHIFWARDKRHQFSPSSQASKWRCTTSQQYIRQEDRHQYENLVMSERFSPNSLLDISFLRCTAKLLSF